MMSDSSWPIEKGRKGLPVWRLNRILEIIHSRTLDLTEDGRELPIVWSKMHMYSTVQIAKLLALKRGLDPELAALTCAFHDSYSLFTGKTKDHGLKAESYIREITKEYNLHRRGSLPEIVEEEIIQIIVAVAVHSDKNSISDDPLTELLRDVDSIDSYLHGLTQGRHSGRIPRGNKFLQELQIDHKISE